MGQIESSNTSNNLSDRKDIVEESKANNYSYPKKLNIDIESNSNANQLSNESEDQNNDKDLTNEKKVNKYDFACTIFYAMVAMLIISTMSRTYTSYSGGGGCGTLYGAQSLLAYTCVGLACAIIRSLRQQIQECPENREELDEKQIWNISNDGSASKTESMKLQNESSKIESITTVLPQSNYLFVDSIAKQEEMLSTDSMNSKVKRHVSFENPNQLSALSAIDLKAIKTDIEKPEYKFMDQLNLDSLKNSKNQLKFNSGPLKEEQSIIQHNCKDYNLNSIDKY